MKQPPYLKAGDQVTIISTARKISETEIQPVKALLESWGLEVKFGANLFAEHHQFAGTEEQRLSDLQSALDDPDSKAIYFARGGYGTVQLIDRLDFSAFRQSPKWLVGYSDITFLHAHINQHFEMESLHAMMPVSLLETGVTDEVKQSLKNALFGKPLHYAIPQSKWNRNYEGETLTAPIVGGNLSILYSLSGTSSQLNTKGRWLFLEDLDEYLYHIDRMLMNLDRVGLFKNCQGVLIGGMSDMNDNKIPYGQTAEEIINHRLEKYRFPLIFGIPAGHIPDNRTIILNRKLNIEQNGDQIELNFHGRT
jgi:muramoyltetrapeptide carboxypeptidase